MNNYLQINKKLLTFFLITLIVLPIFGINFFISFLGNILLLLLLVPILLLLVVYIGFNSFKSNINTCNECGTVSFGFKDTCVNCGAELNNINKKNDIETKPSESTIEIKAEEIK